MINILRSSIFAGIFIGTAGFGFLASGLQGSYGSLVGAVLFSLGLMAVVGYKLKLYTGTAGFIKKNEIGTLFFILFGNIIGCLCMGLLTRVSPIINPETGKTILDVAQGIMETRLRTGALNCGLLGVGCGLLMTTAVTFARKKNLLPLLFAVPLFIVCGFTHCVADAFYYMAMPFDCWSFELLGVYACTVLGNLIGCNLYRIILLAGVQPEE